MSFIDAAPSTTEVQESSPGSLLRVQQLCVAAGAVPLLSNVSLELKAGELMALTGPSGCGKTTLLRTICGLQDAVSGSVCLQGQIAETFGWPQFRRKVLLVEQTPVLIDASLDANLRRPFTYRSTATPFPLDRACDLLDQLGMGAQSLEQNARSLSIGQQQRLALIRALLIQPLVLLLDEPTSALDHDMVATVEHLLRDTVESQPMAALIITHNLQQAEQWCHRRLDMTPHIVPRPSGGPANAGGP